jgi:hypothetical protein
MLVAMAITLVMMAAVVTLFASVSNAVRDRRATIEMTSQLRGLRNALQQDLQGATCPGVTWQRPEANQGYIELIEGPQNDQNPTALIAGDVDGDGIVEYPSESLIDPQLSPIPRNNIGVDGIINGVQDGEISNAELEAHYKRVGSLVPGALGDHDDVLMFTSRNENEPFVGRMPSNIRVDDNAIRFNVVDGASAPGWDFETVESPLAEVVWFCVENPAISDSRENPDGFYGQPGIRTIYRRALLIAPWVNPYSRVENGVEVPFRHEGGTFKAEPGLVRMLPPEIPVEEAIAAIIAFQDRYDLSVRLEWDENIERWKIMANTLADLTKRENRFGHYGYLVEEGSTPSQRVYPYAFVSSGSNYSNGDKDVRFVIDPEINVPEPDDWKATIGAQGAVQAYAPKNPGQLGTISVPVRPFAFIEEPPDDGGRPATANVMLAQQLDGTGLPVRITFGPAPLWGDRRGQDVMMTEVLGFDVRVYDPGAPLYGRRDDPSNVNSPLTVLQPSDPGWRAAYLQAIGATKPGFLFVGQGAYVDMGYWGTFNSATNPGPNVSGTAWTQPWFAEPRSLLDVYYDSRPETDKLLSMLAPGFAVYDTWSLHYENNGVNEDGDLDITGQALIDEGTNGFDEPDMTFAAPPDALTADDRGLNGVDDVGERETVPPYDRPLRGAQVLIRTFEPDSRAIRQVRVNQHFLPE